MVKQVITGIYFFILNKAVVKNVNREVLLTVKNHQKKLRKLTKNCILPFLSKETVTNISSHKLTFDEGEALKFGLTHSIVHPYIKKTDIFACFETIFQSMNSNLVDKRDEGKLRADLSHLAHSYVNSFRPSQKDIKTHKILNQLRKSKNIVFLKPDKGNGIVIVNRADYNKGILDIVNDSNKFKELANDRTICREGKLQRYLRNLTNNGKIEKEIYIMWEKPILNKQVQHFDVLLNF